MAKRPDMRAFFKARIEWHVHGMLSTSSVRLPPAVRKVNGDVTDEVITVVLDDGTEFAWTGGKYASRKVHGCYAPLMPKPVKA